MREGKDDQESHGCEPEVPGGVQEKVTSQFKENTRVDSTYLGRSALTMGGSNRVF